MRTIHRIATVFSFVNLFFGVTNLIGPLVRGNRGIDISTRGRAMGIPVNSYDNILHTVMASMAGMFAIFPDLSTGQLPSPRKIGGRIRQVKDEVVEKIEEKYPEKMPV